MADEYYKQLAIRYKADARLKKCTASIHVEAEDDKLFWKKILILNILCLKLILKSELCFDKYPEINRIKIDTEKYKLLP